MDRHDHRPGVGIRILASADRAGGETCHPPSLRSGHASAIFGHRAGAYHDGSEDLVGEGLPLAVAQRPQVTDANVHDVTDLASQRPTEAHGLTGLDGDQLGARYPAADAAASGALQVAGVPDPEAD